MSAWELRWILLIIGIFILVLIYFLSRKFRSDVLRDVRDQEDEIDQNVAVSMDTTTEEQDLGVDDLNDQLHDLQDMLREERALRSARQTRFSDERRRPKPRTRQGPQAPQEKIVILYVVIAKPYKIDGPSLLEVLNAIGLEYGELDIFHHYVERFGDKQILFSLANMVNPGRFDLDHIDDFRTPGVSLFMRLPGPVEGLKAFNIMLDCAETLAARFRGQLLDDTHSVLTKQAADHLREEIQLFSLRHSSMAHAR